MWVVGDVIFLLAASSAFFHFLAAEDVAQRQRDIVLSARGRAE
jgi:hypothetical protein